MNKFIEDLQLIKQVMSITIYFDYTDEHIRQFVRSRSGWGSEDWSDDEIVFPEELNLTLFQLQSSIETINSQRLDRFAKTNGTILIDVGFDKKVGYNKISFLVKDFNSVKTKIENFLRNHSMEDF